MSPAQDSDPMVVDGLTVETTDGRPLIEDLSLRVGPGETLGVVGESGAGKSVLVRAVLHLLPETLRVADGHVTLLQHSLAEQSQEELRSLRGSKVAAILPGARDQLNPAISVGELMVAAARAHRKVARREARKLAAELLERVGITDPERRLDAYPHELSGGMAQRVCISLALMHDPRLIVSDEPTAGLDVTVQRQVLEIMRDLARREDAAQLIVTRDFGIVAHFCSQVAVMQDGRIVEEGRVDDVLANPREAYTAELLAKSRLVTAASDHVRDPAPTRGP